MIKCIPKTTYECRFTQTSALKPYYSYNKLPHHLALSFYYPIINDLVSHKKFKKPDL